MKGKNIISWFIQGVKQKESRPILKYRVKNGRYKRRIEIPTFKWHIKTEIEEQ